MKGRSRGRAIDPEARYLSPRQAARVLGVSEYLIYQLAGDIPGVRRLGHRILVPRAWVTGGGDVVTQEVDG